MNDETRGGRRRHATPTTGRHYRHGRSAGSGMAPVHSALRVLLASRTAIRAADSGRSTWVRRGLPPDDLVVFAKTSERLELTPVG
jgi:hypothetical protein